MDPSISVESAATGQAPDRMPSTNRAPERASAHYDCPEQNSTDEPDRWGMAKINWNEIQDNAVAFALIVETDKNSHPSPEAMFSTFRDSLPNAVLGTRYEADRAANAFHIRVTSTILLAEEIPMLVRVGHEYEGKLDEMRVYLQNLERSQEARRGAENKAT